MSLAYSENHLWMQRTYMFPHIITLTTIMDIIIIHTVTDTIMDIHTTTDIILDTTHTTVLVGMEDTVTEDGAVTADGTEAMVAGIAEDTTAKS